MKQKNSLFNSINQTETQKKAKHLLQGYSLLKFAQENPMICPKIINPKQKMDLIQAGITKLQNNTSMDYLLAQLLIHRYLEAETVVKSCYLLAQDAQIQMNDDAAPIEFIAERTFYRMQNEALLMFAVLYNAGELVVFKAK